MTKKEIQTKRFIESRGTALMISSVIWVTRAASAGSSTLTVYDAAGLAPGTKLTLPDHQIVTIASVGFNTIEITTALESNLPINTLLSRSSVAKGLFDTPSSTVTRDSVEFSRRVSVAKDTMIPFGSVVQVESGKFFVTGYRPADSSVSIGLKAITETVDWYSDDPSVDGADPSNLRSWVSGPGLTLIEQSLPAYQEQLSLYENLEEPGYVPVVNRYYLIAVWHRIKVGDYLVAELPMRVTGVDPTRVRGMQAVSVSLAPEVSVGG